MLAAVHRSILLHDDSKLFVFTYVALAVVLALWLGLFWLAAVVGVHFVMELIKQYHYDPRLAPALARSLWDLKLDVGLVLAGLAIALYMGLILGAAGIGAAGRVGAQAAARAGLWQRVLRGTLLTLDDVAMVAKAKAVGSGNGDSGDDGHGAVAVAVATGGGGSGEEYAVAGEGGVVDVVQHPPYRPAEPPAAGPALWGGWAAPRWSRGDRIAIGFTIASALLIVAAPLLTDHTVATAWAEIVHEMQPFP